MPDVSGPLVFEIMSWGELVHQLQSASFNTGNVARVSMLVSTAGSFELLCI